MNGWSVSSQISLEGVLHLGIEPFKIKITILLKFLGWEDLFLKNLQNLLLKFLFLFFAVVLFILTHVLLHYKDKFCLAYSTPPRPPPITKKKSVILVIILFLCINILLPAH